MFRLSRTACLVFVNFLFFLEDLGRHILALDVQRILSGDVHRDVLHQRLKLVTACREVGFGIDFDEDAELPSGMNVVSDHAFSGNSGGFLLGGSQALLSQNDDGRFHIALRFDERVLAVHHACAGFLAEIFHVFRVDLHDYPLTLILNRKIATKRHKIHKKTFVNFVPFCGYRFLHHCGFVRSLHRLFVGRNVCAFGLGRPAERRDHVFVFGPAAFGLRLRCSGGILVHGLAFDHGL